MYSKESISDKITTAYMGKSIAYFDEIGSTNDYGKNWARQGVSEGALVVADRQNSGRGRMGRQWQSPTGEGIWMSLVVRPQIDVSCVPQLTIIAGLSMCKAIGELTGLDAKIKWPNDVVIQGKKVCGILAEMGMQGQRILYVILGIGVNVNTQQFDESLPHASSLKLMGQKEYDRADLIGLFLKQFEKYYELFKEDRSLDRMIDEYKNLSITIHKQVVLIEKNSKKNAYVKDITTQGALVIENDEGNIEEVVSGEVSVRGLYGYI